MEPVRALPRFTEGVLLPKRAFGMILKGGGLKVRALLPLLINIVLFGGGLIAAFTYRVPLVELVWLKPENPAWYLASLWYVTAVLIFLVILLIAFFLFTPIGCLIGGPFNDMLSEKTEFLLDPTAADRPFSLTAIIAETAISLRSELTKLLFWVAIIVPALLLNLIPGIGQILFAGISGTVGVFMLALQFADYPMSRRRWTWRRKYAFLRSDLPRTMGFGAGVALLLAIPLLNLLAIPVCVTAGTIFFKGMETKEG